MGHQATCGSPPTLSRHDHRPRRFGLDGKDGPCERPEPDNPMVDRPPARTLLVPIDPESALSDLPDDGAC